MILDPEANSSFQLLESLEEHGDLVCLGQEHSTGDGLNHILKFLPDIVFVHLSQNASEVFGMMSELHQYISNLPIFIGVSRSKDYAYDAIKHNFFDYWLLPFNEFEIRKSILRLRKMLPERQESQMLCLKSYKDFQYLDTDEILYLKADNNTTDFYMRDGSIVSAFKTLKSFESKLPANFIRVHQSYILNTKHVSRINYGKALCTIRKTKTQLPFSRTYRANIDSLKKLLSKNSISTLG